MFQGYSPEEILTTVSNAKSENSLREILCMLYPKANDGSELMQQIQVGAQALYLAHKYWEDPESSISICPGGSLALLPALLEELRKIGVSGRIYTGPYSESRMGMQVNNGCARTLIRSSSYVL